MSLPYRRAVKRHEFIENWNFYLKFPRMLQAGDYELPTYDSKGDEGMFSFICLENGYKVPTKELNLVRRAYEGKMSVNLQMKLWAEDVGLLLMPDELKDYCQGMPKWVFEGTMKQAKKRIVNERGFVPSFLKI
jgi:hypothetical protein